MMRVPSHRSVLYALLLVLLVSCSTESPAPAEPLAPAWDVDRLIAASRSTSSPYVLVTVVDGNAGRTREAAVPFRALEVAVMRERGCSSAEALEFLRTAETRRTEFHDEVALKNVWPRYSLAELVEVRELLKGHSVEQIVADQQDVESALSALSRAKHGGLYGCLPCVLHVLLERDVACGASCKPGLVYVDAEVVNR